MASICAAGRERIIRSLARRVLGESYHVEAQASNGNQLWYLVTVPGARSAWLFECAGAASPANAHHRARHDDPAVADAHRAPLPSRHRRRRLDRILSPDAGRRPSPCFRRPASAAQPEPARPRPCRSRQRRCDYAVVCRGGYAVHADLAAGIGSICGGYSTANNSVSVTLTFTSSTGYGGTAIVTQNDGCTLGQSAWNGCSRVLGKFSAEE